MYNPFLLTNNRRNLADNAVLVYSETMRLWLLVFFSFLFVLPGQAQGAVELAYKQGGLLLTLQVNAARMVSITGLPFAGEHWFDAKSHTLIVQNPEDAEMYRVAPDMFTSAEATAKRLGDTSSAFGQPATRWQLYGGNNGEKICSFIIASPNLAQQARLSVGDIARLNAALVHLYALPHSVCDTQIIPAALSRMIGLPVYEAASNGTITELSTFHATDGFEGPEANTGVPLSPLAHLRFLLRQLDPADRDAFEQASVHLPIGQQLKSLQNLLQQEENL